MRAVRRRSASFPIALLAMTVAPRAHAGETRAPEQRITLDEREPVALAIDAAAGSSNTTAAELRQIVEGVLRDRTAYAIRAIEGEPLEHCGRSPGCLVLEARPE